MDDDRDFGVLVGRKGVGRCKACGPGGRIREGGSGNQDEAAWIKAIPRDSLERASPSSGIVFILDGAGKGGIEGSDGVVDNPNETTCFFAIAPAPINLGPFHTKAKTKRAIITPHHSDNNEPRTNYSFLIQFTSPTETRR